MLRFAKRCPRKGLRCGEGWVKVSPTPSPGGGLSTRSAVCPLAALHGRRTSRRNDLSLGCIVPAACDSETVDSRHFWHRVDPRGLRDRLQPADGERGAPEADVRGGG